MYSLSFFNNDFLPCCSILLLTIQLVFVTITWGDIGNSVIFLLFCLYFSYLFVNNRYFIFTSFWAYKIYYVFGFMFLVFMILTIVTVCVTIVCTYFLLNAEDYRWWVKQFIIDSNGGCAAYSYSDACSCQLAPKAFYNNLSLGLINLIIIQNCLCVSCLCQGRRFIAFRDKWS